MNMSIRRVRLGDPERLLQPLGLRRPGDAELRVGRVRLVAVLGDPDPLLAVEARQLLDEDGDVAERDHVRGRRLPRRRVLERVRLVAVGVELRAAALHAPQEEERRVRRAGRARDVVAARGRQPAGDLLQGVGGLRSVHAVVDLVADARVLDRRGRDPAPADPLPLRAEEGVQVRLVPRAPVADARKGRRSGLRRGRRTSRCSASPPPWRTPAAGGWSAPTGNRGRRWPRRATRGC